jgi:YjbE family integral membrane protein
LNLALLGYTGSSWEFFTGVLTIVLIDIVLAGDNAVVIALAVKSLPPTKRRIGIIFGAGLAVVLRVILTFFAAQLLGIKLLKVVGGLLILWIAVKLVLEDDAAHGIKREAGGLIHAIWMILVADVTMSLDNVLALAGASGGKMGLLIFGLILSIPLVVFASGLLSSLMDRYPIIIYLGAAVLGKVGGQMIVTDPVVTAALEPTIYVQYGVEALCAVGVIAAARLYSSRVSMRTVDPEAPLVGVTLAAPSEEKR